MDMCWGEANLFLTVRNSLMMMYPCQSSQRWIQGLYTNSGMAFKGSTIVERFNNSTSFFGSSKARRFDYSEENLHILLLVDEKSIFRSNNAKVKDSAKLQEYAYLVMVLESIVWTDSDIHRMLYPVPLIHN